MGGSSSSSSSPIILCSPTGAAFSQLNRTKRLHSSFKGVTVGLLDISKGGGATVLSRLEQHLRWGVTLPASAHYSSRHRDVRLGSPAKIIRYCKPSFSKPCPPALREKIVQECDLLVTALAD